VDADWLLIVAVLLWYTSLWLLLGSAVGSFLNVVIYRLPRGLNLAHPPSSCPACRHRIRWYDNVPVLGWLRLGGRCRDCRYPISPRYPLVEATAALILMTLAFAELFSGGANLPFRPREPSGLWSLGQASGELHLLLGLHFLLFMSLLALALIDQDGQPLPQGLFVLPVLAFLVASYFFAKLQPGRPWEGMVVGAITGVAVAWLYDGSGARTATTTAGLVLIGTYLGWRAVLVAALGSLAVVGVVMLSSPRFVFRIPISPLFSASLAAFAYLVAGLR